MEQTITEYDLDSDAREALQGLETAHDGDPDLAIDGMSDSFLSRLLGLFSRA